METAHVLVIDDEARIREVVEYALGREGYRVSAAKDGPSGLAIVSADAVEIFVAIQNAREWARFCKDVLVQADVAEDPRFATNSARVQHRTDLRQLIAAVFSELPGTEILGRLERADIACARRNSVGGFINHPQLLERDCWRTIDSPIGALRALRPPVRMDGVDPVMGGVDR